LLPLLMHQAALGDLKALAAQAVMTTRQLGDQLAVGMQNTVICSEDWPLIEHLQINRADLQKTYQGTDQLDGLRVICAHWPQGPVDPELHAPLRSDVPTLLLSGDADPVTPPQAAERAARLLVNHRHLVLEGEGHGQLATGCVPRLMAAFLDNPEPRTLDTDCLKSHRPAAFFISVNGPAP
jgi:pimeloyl-ACP methyl ester carboxylesterase